MKLKHFKVEKFDKDKIDHYVLVKKIERGSKVDYISPHLMNYLEKAQTKNYVLKDKEGNSLGLFGEKEDKRDNTLELWCILGEENRGKGLGSRFLGEITSYLITEKDISDLKLVIQKENKASRKIAFENGYTVCRPIDETKDEFRYFGKKGK